MLTPRRFQVEASVLLLSAILLFVIANVIRPHPLHDEGVVGWHLETVEKYRQMFLGNQAWTLDCGNSLGVLFYIVHGGMAALNPSLWFVRLPTLFYFAGNLLFLGWWLKPTLRQIPLFLVAFLGCTWMVLSSFTVHGEQAGLLFGFLALGGLILAEENPLARWGGAVSLALIPWVRLFSIFTYGQAAIEILLKGRRGWKLLLWCIVAGLPFLWLVWHWHGLVSPSFAARSGAQNLSFRPERFLRLLYVPAHAGLYLLPWLFLVPSMWKSIRSKVFLAVVVVTVMLSLWVPLGSAGPLDSLMRTLLHIPFEKPFVTVAERVMWIRPVYGVGLGLALILLGRLVLEGRWRSLEIRLPMTAIIIYTVLQPFTGDLFVERYMFPVHVWLTVLMWRLMPPATTNFWPLLPFLLMGLKHGLN